jgi:23S rRNA pseudouridine2605 synthase
MPNRPRHKTRPAPRRQPDTAKSSDGERLQKVLAAAGAGSRRQCEELITTGRVEVDRQVVTELGTKVDPARQEVRLDGVPLSKPRLAYFAVNKPPGVVSTNRDPAQRPRVIDLVKAGEQRLYAIGRLDVNSEGLILVTNDGELANRLTHPRYGVSKTYRVQVAGRPTRETLADLRRGVHLAEGFCRVDGLQVKSHHKESTILEVVLREGKNREIRRILARVGHKVQRLVRIAVGPVKLGDLAPGESRRLTRQEIAALRRAASDIPQPKRPRRAKRSNPQSPIRNPRSQPPM